MAPLEVRHLLRWTDCHNPDVLDCSSLTSLFFFSRRAFDLSSLVDCLQISLTSMFFFLYRRVEETEDLVWYCLLYHHPSYCSPLLFVLGDVHCRFVCHLSNKLLSCLFRLPRLGLVPVVLLSMLSLEYSEHDTLINLGLVSPCCCDFSFRSLSFSSTLGGCLPVFDGHVL